MQAQHLGMAQQGLDRAPAAAPASRPETLYGGLGTRRYHMSVSRDVPAACAFGTSPGTPALFAPATRAPGTGCGPVQRRPPGLSGELETRRGGSPGCCSCSRACSCCGSRSGSSWRCCSSSRPDSRGSRPFQDHTPSSAMTLRRKPAASAHSVNPTTACIRRANSASPHLPSVNCIS